MDTPIERMNLPAVPVEKIPETADLLLVWMRTFWTKLYKDKQFVRYLQESRALACAQLYLDVLEGLALLDHSKAPAFHRERWYPIVIRKSLENRANAASPKIGRDDIDVAAGPASGYLEQVRIGDYFSKEGSVAYPTKDELKHVVSCVVDSIVNPSVVLKPGVDFEVGDRSIVIRRSADPFADGSSFPVFEVPETPDSPATQETVLWACDALVDRNYVSDHMGYAVGLDVASDERAAEIVRHVWDATTDGLNPCHLKQIMAALCRVPCILDDEETVERILDSDSGRTVITDKNVYEFEEQAELAPAVVEGSILSRGDLLDTSVRIYPFVVDVDRVKGYSGFELSKFREDVTSIEIPGAMISGDSSGFYATWDEKDVMYNGLDSNGNPKLSFDIGMDAAESSEFWSNVWSRYEERGDSMEACFDGLDSERTVGQPCGKVVPIKFFLRNLVGANTLIVVVDTDRIPDDAPLYDPNFYNALRKLVPSYVRLYIVEHGQAVDDEFSVQQPPSSDEAVLSYDLRSDELEELEDRYDTSDELVGARWTRKCRNSREDEDD